MDAPQTQYRVIERGGRLIVLDARTNLPPKQAVDLHPGSVSHAEQTRVSVKDMMQQQRSAKRQSERSGRSGVMMRQPGAAGRTANGSTQGGARVFGTLIFVTSFIVVAVIIGGAVGFAIAGVGLLIAGRSIFKIGSASRKLGR